MEKSKYISSRRSGVGTFEGSFFKQMLNRMSISSCCNPLNKNRSMESPYTTNFSSRDFTRLTYGTPEIFNTDQGSQFTSAASTSVLLEKGITVSMDGRERVFDNIFVERLWRTVKYEDIYLNNYQTIPELKEGLKIYFRFYNTERFHQGLNYKTPLEVYSGGSGSKEEAV